MFILGLNGSPRQDGNTVFLLNTALKVAAEMGAETKLLHVAEALETAKVPYCNVCTEPCTGICSKGNKLGEMYELMREADGIIIGSPVYFGTVTAQLKGFWDKTRFLRKDKALVNTVGGVLAVGGARFGGQETTVRAAQDMMLVQGMTVIGDGFFDDDAGHQGACAQRPADEDAFGIKRVQILARRVVEVAGATVDLRKGM
ncbi:MAG: flavodoxin family protein [Thermincolia bacterium]